jgi:hypothetical protein
MNKRTPNPLGKGALKINLHKIVRKISLLALVTNLISNSTTLPTSAESGVNPPLDLELINQPDQALSRGIFTINTISQEGVTNPSLWWIRDQFGRRVVTHWLGYPEERRVDLVVDRQVWSFINYVEKYSLVNHFALTAREYGYNLRIFNDQGLPLGHATCEFIPTDNTNSSIGSSSPRNCQINLFLLSDRGLPANRRRVPALF